jgi:2,3-bisphosphoglycerate-dependent phosphoglycerate mutase
MIMSMITEVVTPPRAFNGITEGRAFEMPNDTAATAGHVRFFIMRHGESLGQINPDAYKNPGDALIPLTEWGHRQSRDAGQFLRQVAEAEDIDFFDVRYSKSLRTKQTTINLMRGAGHNLIGSRQADSRLDKQAFGLFDGIFSDREKARLFPAEFQKYREQAADHGCFHACPPEGESIAGVRERSSNFIQDILNGQTSNARNIIIVTHGTNALLLEDALINHGKAWVLNNIDKGENCSIRLVQGSNGNYSSQAIGHGVRRPDLSKPYGSGQSNARGADNHTV